MKKMLIVGIATLLLAGCGKEEVTQTKQENPAKGTSADEQMDSSDVEEKFITSALESAKTLQAKSEQLQTLLEGIDPGNVSWKNDVESILDQIHSDTTDYLLSEAVLTNEHLNKYKDTIDSFDSAINEIQSIADDIGKGIETYDKKSLEEANEQLDSVPDLLQKGVEQLEKERYE